MSLEAITECVAEALRASDPSFVGLSLELRRSWTSRTARLYRFRVNGLPDGDIVVKQHTSSEPALIEYQAMIEAADALEAYAPDDSAPVRPLAVSEELGALVMPHVEGELLSRVLAEEDWSRASVKTRIADLMKRCGRVLAAYHRHFEERGREEGAVAWEDLVRRFVNVVGHTGIPRELVADSVVSKNYIDFHPRHIILGKEDRLTLIDPPPFDRWAFVQRDLARFHDRLFMLMLRPGWRAPLPLRVRFHEALCDEFLAAYADFQGRSLGPNGRVALKVYEAFFLRRKWGDLWSTRSFSALLFYGTPVAYRYHRLRREISRFLVNRREYGQGS